jgi:hypothetical protein
MTTSETAIYDGREVKVADWTSNPKGLEIELLLDLQDRYGTATEQGFVWRATKAELLKHLKWVFRRPVLVVRTTLVR